MDSYNERYSSIIANRLNRKNRHNDDNHHEQEPQVRIRSIEEIGEPYYPSVDADRLGDRGGHTYKGLNQFLQHTEDEPPLMFKSEENILNGSFNEHMSGLQNDEDSTAVDFLQLRQKIILNGNSIGRPIPLPYRSRASGLSKPSIQRSPSEDKQRVFSKAQRRVSTLPDRRRSSIFSKANTPLYDDEFETDNNNDHVDVTLNDSKTVRRAMSSNLPPPFQKPIGNRVSSVRKTTPTHKEYTITLNNEEDLVDLWESIVDTYNRKKLVTYPNHQTENSSQKDTVSEFLPHKLKSQNWSKYKEIAKTVFTWDVLLFLFLFVTLIIYNWSIYSMYRDK